MAVEYNKMPDLFQLKADKDILKKKGFVATDDSQP